MEKLLAKHMLKEIPEVSQAGRDAIVAVVLGHSISQSVDELASSLVDSGVELGSLVASVVHCQWLIVQNLMNKKDSEHNHAQLRSFSLCVERSTSLQTFIVNAFDRHWHANFQDESTGRVMLQAKAQWMKEGVVHLHNYFHAMPVTAKAKYIDSTGVNLTVAVTEEVGRVFSATHDMHDAWVTGNNETYQLLMRVADCRNMKLTLMLESVEKSKRELRRDVRVQPEDSIQMELRGHSGVFPAVMRDLSITGIGLMFKEPVSLIPGELLGCVFKLNEEKLFLEIEIRWVSDSDGRGYAGVRLKSLGPFSEQLRRFTFAQQQLCIKLLKQLNAPAWMRK